MARSTSRVSLGFNRRDFLRTTAALPAAAGAGYFAYQRLEGGPVRTVLVGTGKQGREALIRQAPVGVIQYVGFYDVRPSQVELAKKEFTTTLGAPNARRVKQYADWKDVLADKKVEAIVLATPTQTHARLAIDALKAGKHVYCEAPIADGLVNAKAMARVARDQARVLAIGHQRAANAKYLEAAASVRGGSLGEYRYIETFSHQNLLGNDPWAPAIPAEDAAVQATNHGFPSAAELVQWRLARNSGGAFLELAAQQIDALRVLLGDRDALPIAVRGSGNKTLSGRTTEHEDHAYLIFEFPDERLIVTWAGIATNAGEGIGEMILGSRGSLWLLDEKDLQVGSPPAPPPPGGNRPVGDTKTVKVSVDAVQKGAPTMYSAASTGYTAASKGVSSATSVGYSESLKKFAEAVRGRGPVACSPEQAIQTLAVALAAQKAVKQKQRIVIDPDWLKLDSAAAPDGKPVDPSLAREAGLSV
jgi:predicted dehydrogenase